MGTFLQEHADKNFQFEWPTLEIKIADKEWTSENIQVTYVKVSSDVWSKAGVCNIELTLFDANEILKESKIEMPDEFSGIKIGVKFELSLGYWTKNPSELTALNQKSSKNVSTVFKGYISNFKRSAKSDSIVFEIEAMDGLMWLMANKKTELKKDKKKYSAIIIEMLGKYSGVLPEKSVEIKGEIEYETPIYQTNQSDFDFIKEVCEKFGCLFFISNGKCFVSKIADLNNGSKITIDYDGQLEQYIETNADILGIPKKVEVIGTDPKDYTKQIKSEVTKVSSTVGSKGKETNTMSNSITNNNVITVVDNDVASVDEAKALAEAILNLKAFKSLVTKLKMHGYQDVVLGQKVTLKKFGPPTDNDYLVTGIEHEISKESESDPYIYYTTITLNSDKIEAQT